MGNYYYHKMQTKVHPTPSNIDHVNPYSILYHEEGYSLQRHVEMEKERKTQVEKMHRDWWRLATAVVTLATILFVRFWLNMWGLFP